MKNPIKPINRQRNLLRRRSLEAARQKASRGKLQFCLPAGYCQTHHDKIEMEPDQRIRRAIASVSLPLNRAD